MLENIYFQSIEIMITNGSLILGFELTVINQTMCNQIGHFVK